MVGIVLVSHSEKLAEGLAQLVRAAAPDARIAPAGGLEDGGLGTSFSRIKEAVEAVYSPDGVLLLMDMGSAVMTTEMVLEFLELPKAEMADCPLVEGALVAAVGAAGGLDFETIKRQLLKVGTTKKLS